MSLFETYLKLGISHITDLNAYDHMVFLLAVCAFQDLKHWKQLLILITAFTVGHSLTLGMALFKVISFPVEIIEFLIPVTIFITSIAGFINRSSQSNRSFNYVLILIFGLIHGVGFSNYLRQLLGEEVSLVLPLFSFNLGIELGQILIVLVILAVKSAIELLPFIEKKKFQFWLSGIAAGIAVILMTETIFW
jgi:hypothetical protein